MDGVKNGSTVVESGKKDCSLTSDGYAFALKLKDDFKEMPSLKAVCNKNNIDFFTFTANVCYQVSTDEKLQQCDRKSIIECCVKSAQIGLKIDANEYAYLLPFGKKCSIIVSYKGYIKLIRSNPKVASISTFTISTDDIEQNRLFIEEGENRTLIYKRNLSQDEATLEDEKIAGFLAIVYYKSNSGNGNKFYDYCYITKNDVNDVRDSSNSYKNAYDKKNTIWAKHYVAMGKKTAIRRLVKFCNFPELSELNQLDNEDYIDDKKTMKDADVVTKKRKSFTDLANETNNKKQDVTQIADPEHQQQEINQPQSEEQQDSDSDSGELF